MEANRFDEAESLVVLKSRMIRDYKRWGARLQEMFPPASFARPGPRHVPIELDDEPRLLHLEERLFGGPAGAGRPVRLLSAAGMKRAFV